MMDKSRLFIKVSGVVQGVNFRYYIQEKAQALSLSGWVKNAFDGGVEVMAEGHKEKLERLLEWAKKGPSFAQVDRVEYEWRQYKGEFKGFEIVY